MYTKYLNLLFTRDSFLTYLKKEGSRRSEVSMSQLLRLANLKQKLSKLDHEILISV